MPHVNAIDDEYDVYRNEGEEDEPAIDRMRVMELNARFEQALHPLKPVVPQAMTAQQREAALSELAGRAKEKRARKTINRQPSSQGDERS
jgi:hypothetical protein